MPLKPRFARQVWWMAGVLGCVALGAATGGLTLAESGHREAIYVGSFGDKRGADTLRQDLVEVLKHTPGLAVVDSADKADAVVEGAGEVWVKGYYTLNPRQRMVSSEVRRVYAGYLSIELKDKHNATLWSYQATPKPEGGEDVPRWMATQAVKKLLVALDKMPPAPPERGAR